MTTAVLFTFCALLLFAYIFDVTAAKTRIPSVVLLLLLGFSVQQATRFIGLELPDFRPFLPILGTIGLILIVLEGSLEVDLNRNKFGIIKQSLLGAIIPMFILAFGISGIIYWIEPYSFKTAFTNVVPLCVISSAIAIPSARFFHPNQKEFVIYESSVSDILGVLIFNFVTVNAVIDFFAFLQFGWQLILITLISFGATIVLALLLSKIKHHVKYLPIILIMILVYTITKQIHLPGLIFILIFGLFIRNIDELKQFKIIERFKPEVLKREVKKFHELTAEATFLVRSLFFLLFGFLIEVEDVLNTQTLIWAGGITAAIFIIRAVQLYFSEFKISPLLFVAPRGLINILLLLSIESQDRIPLINESLLIQIIILTALVMMFGLLNVKPYRHHPSSH